MHTKLQNTSYYLQVVFLALVIGIGLQIASAWTPPNSAPPTQTVSAPITTGTVSQIKQSSLSLAGNLVANQVQINTVVTQGAACTSNGLLARDTNGLILSCQSLVWKPAQGSVLSGSLCGAAYGSTIVPCQGVNPMSGCPPGYHLGYIALYQYSCVKS
jgi:hypothetical protein